MPVRATKRGAERTPLHADWDVIVCGASFAGLAVCRELAGIRRARAHARPLRGRRAPDERLRGADRVAARPRARGLDAPDLPATSSSTRRRRPSAGPSRGRSRPSTTPSCAPAARAGARRRVRHGQGRRADGIHPAHRPRRPHRAADRRRPRLAAGALQRAAAPSSRPEARLSRGLEVHPHASGDDLELWLDPAYVRAGYSWSFPARDELRVGVGSFEPRDHVKEPTVRLADDLDVPAVRYQGNWIPHQMRAPVEDGIFFVGDSAGHCLPTTAEGIRTALYFGLACGRELRLVLEGRQTREQALTRYADFCEEHRWAFTWLLRVQRWVGRLNPYPAMTSALRADGPPVLHRLVLRALPRDRPAGLRRRRPPEPSRTPARRPNTLAWSSVPCRPCSCARPSPCSTACAWRASSSSSRSCSSRRRSTPRGSSAPSRTPRSPSAPRSAWASTRSSPPSGCWRTSPTAAVAGRPRRRPRRRGDRRRCPARAGRRHALGRRDGRGRRAAWARGSGPSAMWKRLRASIRATLASQPDRRQPDAGRLRPPHGRHRRAHRAGRQRVQPDPRSRPRLVLRDGRAGQQGAARPRDRRAREQPRDRHGRLRAQHRGRADRARGRPGRAGRRRRRHRHRLQDGLREHRRHDAPPDARPRPRAALGLHRVAHARAHACGAPRPRRDRRHASSARTRSPAPPRCRPGSPPRSTGCSPPASTACAPPPAAPTSRWASASRSPPTSSWPSSSP